MSKPNRDFDQAYAVVRVDFPFDPSAPEHSISVVKVEWTEEAVKKEVSRLNEVNKGRCCKYFDKIVRVVKREKGD